MNSQTIINLALKLSKKYGNVYSYIKENGIILKNVDIDMDIKGLSFQNIIFINSNVKDYEKDFIIAHELGHIILHDEQIRRFSKIETFKGSREETQANLFATVFLGYQYNDVYKNDIQCIVNNIYCNYLSK